MERRRFLAAAGRSVLVVAAAGLLPAHTPYRQWVIYRKRHLMILASKRDPDGYAKCRSLAERLAAALPESRARPSRAANAERMASLLSTGQMDLAVVEADTARAMLAGEGPSAGYGPIDLRLLQALEGGHLLVARAAFPAAHAYRVAAALGAADPGPGAPLPLHPGVAAFLSGAPAPAGPEAEPTGEGAHDH
ncbi:MAG: hypothetical protein MI785_14730 [Kiloniellales bacterium]|nr:hypothetical protein [Kiloniellales bacterium]